MSEKNDRVFQLSLTEIAFLLVFLLMLLLGYSIYKLSEDLNRCNTTSTLESALKRLEMAKKELTEHVAALGVDNPEDIVAKLVDQASLVRDLDVCKGQVVDLNTRISALTEAQAMIDKFGADDKAQKDEIEEALNVKRSFEDAFPNVPVSEIMRSINETTKLKADIDNLKGQVSYMTEQSKKCVGFPPCWVDKNGKPQRLFAIEVTERGQVVVQRGWPPERDADAMQLPNMEAILATTGEQSIQKFGSSVEPILRLSKQTEPECRHWASISFPASARGNAIATGVNAVRGYFYQHGSLSTNR